MLRLSVITPSFNQGRFIGDNLQSVRDALPEPSRVQDRWLVSGGVSIEHVVVDGLSRDKTAEVVQRYPHVRWISEADEGQSDALNKGFSLARGEWILWLNADDYLLPGALNAYFQEIERSATFDVAYGHSRLIDGEKRHIKTNYAIPFWYPFIFFLTYLPPTSGTLFRADLLQSNPLDLDFHYTMDREWFLRCGRSLRARRMSREIAAFRVTESSKTGNFTMHGILPEQHRKEQHLNFERHILPRLPVAGEKSGRWFLNAGRMLLRQVVRLLKLKEAATLRMARRTP